MLPPRHSTWPRRASTLTCCSNLVMKWSYTVPDFTTEWATRQLQLPVQLVQELCWQLKQDRFLEILGQLGPFSHKYAATERGRNLAHQLMEISGYLGPAAGVPGRLLRVLGVAGPATTEGLGRTGHGRHRRTGVARGGRGSRCPCHRLGVAACSCSARPAMGKPAWAGHFTEPIAARFGFRTALTWKTTIGCRPQMATRLPGRWILPVCPPGPYAQATHRGSLGPADCCVIPVTHALRTR